MRAVQHHSNNDVLGAPLGVTIEQCKPLAITRVRYTDGSHGVWSYWRPDATERAAIAAGADVCLMCVGQTHPPVLLAVDGAPLPSGGA
ncbi:hypothetical protein [Paracidovorax citrulli]|uniref:hypothetical protein n=1 Tax=Paracidovorax citrulli TaxID=80869 RepID=UPI0005FBC632|nr:hypothetical protein [Paracidovorax citrulli]